MSKLLHEVGEALYGPRWQSDLARALGVSDRTMRRWASDDDVPAGVLTEVKALCEARADVLRELGERIDAQAAAQSG